MVKLTPSKLIRELGTVASGQPKVLTTCCVERCLNEVEVIQTSPEADLAAGTCFYPCSFHQRDPGVAAALAALLGRPKFPHGVIHSLALRSAT